MDPWQSNAVNNMGFPFCVLSQNPYEYFFKIWVVLIDTIQIKSKRVDTVISKSQVDYKFEICVFQFEFLKAFTKETNS